MKNITPEMFKVFEGGSDSFFEALNDAALVQTHEKGRLLFVHEDVAERFFVVKSGWVKLFRETLDGAQSIVDVLAMGHMFGETAIFEDGRYHRKHDVQRS